MSYERVLGALGDPTRQRLCEHLRQGDRTVGELAGLLRISQPAASQHLRVLREAKLVTRRSEGVRRHYRMNAEGLAELRRYVESFWDAALTAYAEGAPPLPERSRGTTKGSRK